MTTRNKSLCLYLLAIISLGTHATDIDMGEYEALPEGTHALLLYYKGAETDALFAEGNKILGDAHIRADAMVLRYAHYQKIRGYLVAAPQFILPFGKYTSSGNLDNLGGAEGVGDLRIPAPIFLLNDTEHRRTFVLNPILHVPIGSYDNDRALNLGENRWVYELQIGGTTRIAKKWNFEIATGIEVFGNNTDFGPNSDTLEQDPRYKTQIYLNYYANPTLRFALGASHKSGGESRISGVRQNDELSTTRFIVNAAKNITPTDQLLISISRETSVRNGLRDNGRVILRWLHLL